MTAIEMVLMTQALQTTADQQWHLQSATNMRTWKTDKVGNDRLGNFSAKSIFEF